MESQKYSFTVDVDGAWVSVKLNSRADIQGKEFQTGDELARFHTRGHMEIVDIIRNLKIGILPFCR